ncbi:MAG: UDP-glucose 4-epimerase GalE [Clostridia bacterium]|nr:UDP-glucose 4-epimerase GalE [Clostridia bacterium]
MKILIVGGAGYIGSHNVRLFLDRGYEVVIVDNLNTGHMSAVDKRAKFYKCDIRDKAELKAIFEKEQPDGVVHFAALSLVGVSMKQPLEYFSNNVYGMQILLEVMKETGVNKIVFSSSAATYGDVEKMPITEDTPTNPINPYGETKLMMEKMMKWCDMAYGIHYVSLRYFNAAGAYDDSSIGEDHNPETHLIPLILQVPLGKRDHISVFGNDYDTRDGTCIRDYIHIMDLADAHVRAIEYLLKGGESQIFNLGTGDGQSVNEMIVAAEKAVGKPIKKEYAARRAGDPARLIASNKKAKDILGWEPKYSLDKIMETAWLFHQKHPDGYNDK